VLTKDVFFEFFIIRLSNTDSAPPPLPENVDAAIGRIFDGTPANLLNFAATS